MRFETALVVDDDPATRSLLRQLLEILGIRVRVACDGREGLEMIRRQAPELLITDVRMPGMTGLELTTRLRREPGAVAGIPVVAVTRHPEDLDGSELFDLVVRKPVRAHRLVSWIQG